MASAESLTRLKTGIMVLFILSFLMKTLVPLEFFPYFMGSLVGLYFFLGHNDLKPLNRRLILLLSSCSGLFIWMGPAGFHWSRAVIENAGFVTLLMTVPMLGTILYFAPYEQVLLAVANRFIRTSFVFHATRPIAMA